MLQLSWGRRLLLLAAVAGFVLVPTAAQADPSFYKTPLFGSAKTPNGTLLVADAGQGIVNGDTGALVASLPGVTDIAPITNTLVVGDHEPAPTWRRTPARRCGGSTTASRR